MWAAALWEYGYVLHKNCNFRSWQLGARLYAASGQGCHCGCAQTLVSRVNNPLKPLVLTFSGVNGGTQFNIITDLVQMTAYLYAEAKEDLTAMQPQLAAICESTAAALGCTAELNFGECEGGAAE